MIVLEKVYTKTLENRLGLTKNAQMLFEEVSNKDFPIFDFKRETKENELVVLTSLILQKHNIFVQLNLDLDLWMKFIDKIQAGYNPVAYHNKSHAADVAQTLYYFLLGGDWK